jgi:integrase
VVPMAPLVPRSISGHVFRVERKSGPVWYAKYRLPDGRQVQKKLGPAWTERGRPAAGYFTKRTAEAWLREVLDEARRGVLVGMVRTGVRFAEAAEDYLLWLEFERDRKPSTLRGYRTIVRGHLLPAFGDVLLEDLTPERLERWAGQLGSDRPLSNASKIRILTVLAGICKRATKVHKLPRNPAATLEKPIQRRRTIALDVFSPAEVMALVRAADEEQDAAIFLTAAFTGLRRGELVALRWRDVSFAGQYLRVTASYTERELSTPKSGKVRSVPLAPEVAQALARLSQRGQWTSEDDLVFPGFGGGYLDASALYRRYKLALQRAGLRDLRFHDLRHTFGTRAISKASILQVKEWMGHADVQTTMQYLHYSPRPQDALLLAEAFRDDTLPGAGGAPFPPLAQDDRLTG